MGGGLGRGRLKQARRKFRQQKIIALSVWNCIRQKCDDLLYVCVGVRVFEVVRFEGLLRIRMKFAGFNIVRPIFKANQFRVGRLVLCRLIRENRGGNQKEGCKIKG